MHTLVESTLKHCNACDRDLPLESFAKDRTKPDGRCNRCRTCKGAYKSEWQKRNRLKLGEYRTRQRERVDPGRTERIELKKQAALERDLRAIIARRAKRNQRIRTRQVRKAEREAKYLRQCSECGAVIMASRGDKTCSEACQNQRVARLERKRYRDDIRFNLTKKFRIAVRDTLTNKQRRHAFDLLPYTAEQLEARLRSTMPSGCTWDDYVAGRLHVDHVIPVRAFNFSSPEDPDFARCWALSNLQLLRGADNCRKGGKIGTMFQPMLSYARAL